MCFEQAIDITLPLPVLLSSWWRYCKIAGTSPHPLYKGRYSAYKLAWWESSKSWIEPDDDDDDDITSALSTWKEILSSIVYPVPINPNQCLHVAYTGISTLYFSLMLITVPAGLVFDHFCFDHFDMLMSVAWWPKLTGDSDDQEFKLGDAHDRWILVCFFIVWYAIIIIVTSMIIKIYQYISVTDVTQIPGGWQQSKLIQ